MAGIGLAMPASWSRIDLDPDTSEQHNRQLVEETIPPGPGADRARDLMLRLLQQAADAAGERAVLSAVYSSVVDGIPLGASLVASVLDATPGPDGTATPEGSALVDSLLASVGPGGERADLPGGPGVRVRRRHTVATEGTELEVETVQWFALHPTGQWLAVLSFSTPNTGLAEPFGELFDAIAWSLQWTN